MKPKPALLHYVIWLLLPYASLAKAPATVTTADAVLGRWYFPARQSTIEVFRAGDHYYARITEVGGSWQKNFAKTKGMVVLTDLTYGGNEWGGGELIHPETGFHFDVALTLKDANTLIATIYKGVRWLHKDFTLVRMPS